MCVVVRVIVFVRACDGIDTVTVRWNTEDKRSGVLVLGKAGTRESRDGLPGK